MSPTLPSLSLSSSPLLLALCLIPSSILKTSFSFHFSMSFSPITTLRSFMDRTIPCGFISLPYLVFDSFWSHLKPWLCPEICQILCTFSLYKLSPVQEKKTKSFLLIAQVHVYIVNLFQSHYCCT